MFRYDNRIKEEPENTNLERCDICKMVLTTKETCETDSESSYLTPRRNPSRSAKRNVVYRENDLEVDSSKYSIKQDCWKCSEVKTEPSKIKPETLTIDDQSESDSTGHHQSEVPFLEKSSVKEKRFKCNVCDKMFTQKSHLKRHIRAVHDKIKPFLCPHCPHKVTTSSCLKKHILTHTGEKNFMCDICDKTFILRPQLKKHIRAVHDKIKPFPCPHCPYKTTTSSCLKKHIVTHTGEKNFKCDICDKMFTGSGYLKLHIRTVHDKIKAFPCPHCPYKATTSPNLKKHIVTHTGEKNFKCGICDMTFTQRSGLKLHIRTVHDKIKAFPCPHCPYEAALSGTIKRHILTHTGEKNFKCDICDLKFSLISNLKKHIRAIHDKIKPFECPQCPYKAARKAELDNHILTHTGEKKFKCEICDKKFSLTCNLIRHIRGVHDKVKAFPCPHCPYKAAESSIIKKHIRTHTGEKNFKCDICDKKYRTSSHLNRHIITAHDKVRAFPCPHCPYKAAERGTLKKHILTHTGEKNAWDLNGQFDQVL